jgi:hypothetical protein
MKSIQTKIYLLAAIVLTLAVANKTQAQVTFGIRGGINFFNINGHNEAGQKLDNKLKTGFDLGVNIEAPLAQDFYIQPGLLFASKGGKSTIDNGEKATYRLSYLEVPVNFIYKPEVGTGKLLLGAGPYLGFGLGGKVKSSSGAEADIKFKSTAGNDPSVGLYYKPVDFGANLLVGYEFTRHVSVQLNAQLGLTNNSPYKDGSSYKNTGFGLSLGYRF